MIRLKPLPSISTTWFPFSSSAFASSAVMYLPISLVGYEKAVSKGSTLTCVIIVDTGL